MSVETATTAGALPGAQLAAIPGVAAVAAAHYSAVTGVRDAAVAAAIALWLTMNEDEQDLDALWSQIAARLFVLLFAAQQAVVDLAEAYVDDILVQQGIQAERAARIDRDAFPGYASDGRDLEWLLDQPLVTAKTSLARGEDRATALARGAAALERIVNTQVMDAVRTADQLAIVTLDPDTVEVVREFEPAPGTTGSLAQQRRESFIRGQFGYIRVLTPPSCGRCAVLAGKWYPWSEGFQRHPNCDCYHVPVQQELGDDLIIDAQEYFDSLSYDEQKKLFGKGIANAIIDGADISQAVNSTSGIRSTADSPMTYTINGVKYTRAGTTRRGSYGRDNPGQPRMTPEAIYREAGDDRILALSLLEKYGYLLE